MITDPARKKVSDKGHPDVCAVFSYQSIFNTKEADSIKEKCKKGTIGCVECKKRLNEIVQKILSPIREKREKLKKTPGIIKEVLKKGKEKAEEITEKTLYETKKAMRI